MSGLCSGSSLWNWSIGHYEFIVWRHRALHKNIVWKKNTGSTSEASTSASTTAPIMAPTSAPTSTPISIPTTSTKRKVSEQEQTPSNACTIVDFSASPTPGTLPTSTATQYPLIQNSQQNHDRYTSRDWRFHLAANKLYKDPLPTHPLSDSLSDPLPTLAFRLSPSHPNIYINIPLLLPPTSIQFITHGDCCHQS